MTSNEPDVRSGSSRSLVREGVFDAVKIGAGETYLGAFGVFLGGTPIQVGALATLPPLVGAMAQSIGVRLVERFRSRRAVLKILIRAQGAFWFPIAVLPFLLGHGWYSVVALVALAVLYQIATGIISPVWTSLVGDLISQQSRGQFFGYRNRWTSIVTFATLVIAGELIHQFTASGMTVYGFMTVFILAGAARIYSANAFAAIDDPPLHVPDDSKFTFWQFISRVRHSNFVRFVLFVSCMNFAVAVSGPYFAMYMLRDLQLSYIEYTCVVSAAVVAQFVVMRSWGALSDEFGNRKILKVCGWLVALNPWFWLLSGNLWVLVVVQLYSGFSWAGFNLAAANFVFDAVTPAKRARCIAYQAIINGVLVFAGSLVGGLLATYLPTTLTDHVGLWVPASPFLTLFLISGLTRLAVMMALFPAFREVRAVNRIRSREMLIRVTTIRPLWGATFAFLSNKNGSREGRSGREPL